MNDKLTWYECEGYATFTERRYPTELRYEWVCINRSEERRVGKEWSYVNPTGVRIFNFNQEPAPCC